MTTNEFVAKTKEEIVQDNSDEEELLKWQSKQVKNWHLPRPAAGESAFQARSANEIILKAKQDGEFIPLGSDDVLELNSGSYHPLCVKRCKPNVDKANQKKAKRRRK